ncbi:MAG: hypothetical protein HY268_16515 [Deltaproteobacteria bacterium]|nr:hypothetical protein [Deltaproteobacteria bacterium]
MELKALLAELVSNLALLDFVTSMNLQTEAFTVKGRVSLQEKGFLEVYFNEQTQTLAIAWIEGEKRQWGIDRDNLRGWHRHPLNDPEAHEPIAATSIRDILKELEQGWKQSS